MRNYRARVLKTVAYGGIIFNVDDIVDVTEHEGHPFLYIEKYDEDGLQYLALFGVPKEMIEEIT